METTTPSVLDALTPDPDTVPGDATTLDDSQADSPESVASALAVESDPDVTIPPPIDPDDSQAVMEALSGLPTADPVAVKDSAESAVGRHPYRVTVAMRGQTYGPFAPAGGAVDESEAKQRVLDAESGLKQLATSGVAMQWTIERV